MIDLRTVRHVLALAEHRHFARAAGALQLTQPALSRSIATLEKKLGVRLFDRGRGGAELTAFGRLLIERGAGLVRESEEMERAIGLLKNLEIGELVVASGPYPAMMSLGAAIGRLARRHPGVRVRLRVMGWREVRQRLLAGEMDLAVFGAAPVRHADALVVERLPPHPGVFFCRAGHPLLEESSLSLERVLDFPLAGSALPPRIARFLHAAAAGGSIDEASGRFVPRLCVDWPATAVQVVRESDAVGVALAHAIEHEIAAGELVVLPIGAPWLHTEYGFVTRRNQEQSPAARAFMAEVRAVEEELVAAERAIVAGLARRAANRVRG